MWDQILDYKCLHLLTLTPILQITIKSCGLSEHQLSFGLKADGELDVRFVRAGTKISSTQGLGAEKWKNRESLLDELIKEHQTMSSIYQALSYTIDDWKNTDFCPNKTSQGEKYKLLTKLTKTKLFSFCDYVC